MYLNIVRIAGGVPIYMYMFIVSLISWKIKLGLWNMSEFATIHRIAARCN